MNALGYKYDRIMKHYFNDKHEDTTNVLYRNDFIKRYKAEYDKMPGSEAAYNYLALHALVEAMDATESTDPKTIRAAIGDALKNMDTRKNPYEVTEVTENGGFVTETTLAVVKDGEIVREEIK